MSVHHVVTAVLLFAAAVGWAFTSVPLPRWPALPSGCVLLGIVVLLAGLYARSDRDL